MKTRIQETIQNVHDPRTRSPATGAKAEAEVEIEAELEGATHTRSNDRGKQNQAQTKVKQENGNAKEKSQIKVECQTNSHYLSAQQSNLNPDDKVKDRSIFEKFIADSSATEHLTKLIFKTFSRRRHK